MRLALALAGSLDEIAGRMPDSALTVLTERRIERRPTSFTVVVAGGRAGRGHRGHRAEPSGDERFRPKQPSSADSRLGGLEGGIPALAFAAMAVYLPVIV
jgi:hypothetical protein